jgi:hypothetical protein
MAKEKRVSTPVRPPKSWLLALGLASVLPGLAAAQNVPFERRAGLWKATMVVSGKPTTIGGCIDETTEKRNAAAMGKSAETTPEPIPGGYRLHSTHAAAGHTLQTVVTIKGDFKSAYSVDTDSQMDGKAQPSLHVDVKWAGPCPAGMRPGQTLSQFESGRAKRRSGGH